MASDNAVAPAQGFVLMQVAVPPMPANATAEQRNELRRLYTEYGQLYDLYYSQCHGDLTQARLFWNQCGPVTSRGKRPNWSSDRMLGDRLSKLRSTIRALGGDPSRVQTPPLTTVPSSFTAPVPTSAPPPAPGQSLTAAPAPANAPTATQDPIFRPVSPGNWWVCPVVPNAHSHVTPPWPKPENLSPDNLPEGWTYRTNPLVDYGYGFGFYPPQNLPEYNAEYDRRRRAFSEEIKRDMEIADEWQKGHWHAEASPPPEYYAQFRRADTDDAANNLPQNTNF